MVDLWESIGRSEGDVELRCADGVVSTHSNVLNHASPVLAAMLQGGFKEGQERAIAVQKQQASVRLFVDLLHCGASQAAPDAKAAVEAFELAHLWQVPHVGAMLGRELGSLLSDDTFAVICETAVRTEHRGLTDRCAEFARNSAKVKARVEKGDLPAAVLGLLQAEPAKKRRRTL